MLRMLDGRKVLGNERQFLQRLQQHKKERLLRAAGGAGDDGGEASTSSPLRENVGPAGGPFGAGGPPRAGGGAAGVTGMPAHLLPSAKGGFGPGPRRGAHPPHQQSPPSGPSPTFGPPSSGGSFGYEPGRGLPGFESRGGGGGEGGSPLSPAARPQIDLSALDGAGRGGNSEDGDDVMLGATPHG